MTHSTSHGNICFDSALLRSGLLVSVQGTAACPEQEFTPGSLWDWKKTRSPKQPAASQNASFNARFAFCHWLLSAHKE